MHHCLETAMARQQTSFSEETQGLRPTTTENQVWQKLFKKQHLQNQKISCLLVKVPYCQKFLLFFARSIVRPDYVLAAFKVENRSLSLTNAATEYKNIKQQTRIKCKEWNSMFRPETKSLCLAVFFVSIAFPGMAFDHFSHLIHWLKSALPGTNWTASSLAVYGQ